MTVFIEAECLSLKEAYLQRKAEAKQAAEENAKKAHQLTEEIRAGSVVEVWSISVPTPSGKQDVVCYSNDTVLALKNNISQYTQKPVEVIRLIYAGKQLEDGRTLQDYNIDRYSISRINLTYRTKDHTDHASSEMKSVTDRLVPNNNPLEH